MKADFRRQLNTIIKEYETVVKVVDRDAQDSDDRAYGGVVRSVKGKLQEYISESLIKIAWESVGGASDDLEINAKKIGVPMNPAYLERIQNAEVKQHIEANLSNYVYRLSVDKHVFIRGKFVIAIECKAYTENAMLKRILVDFEFLRSQYPDLSCYLFQLESQLGGDYRDLSIPTYGSPSTHTIQSHFSSDLTIVTLLQGERNINRPLHKHFKPLKFASLSNALDILARDMVRYK